MDDVVLLAVVAGAVDDEPELDPLEELDEPEDELGVVDDELGVELGVVEPWEPLELPLEFPLEPPNGSTYC